MGQFGFWGWKESCSGTTRSDKRGRSFKEPRGGFRPPPPTSSLSRGHPEQLPCPTPASTHMVRWLHGKATGSQGKLPSASVQRKLCLAHKRVCMVVVAKYKCSLEEILMRTTEDRLEWGYCRTKAPVLTGQRKQWHLKFGRNPKVWLAQAPANAEIFSLACQHILTATSGSLLSPSSHLCKKILPYIEFKPASLWPP